MPSAAGWAKGREDKITRDTVDLLEQVLLGTGDDQAQAKRVTRPLDLKRDCHYGRLMDGTTELRRPFRAAALLVSAPGRIAPLVTSGRCPASPNRRAKLRASAVAGRRQAVVAAGQRPV